MKCLVQSYFTVNLFNFWNKAFPAAFEQVISLQVIFYQWRILFVNVQEINEKCLISSLAFITSYKDETNAPFSDHGAFKHSCNTFICFSQLARVGFFFSQTVWWPDFTLNVNQQTNGSELTVLEKVYVHQSHYGKQIVAALLIMSVLCFLLATFPPLSLVVTCCVCLMSEQEYWNEDGQTNTEVIYYLSSSPEPYTLYSSWSVSMSVNEDWAIFSTNLILKEILKLQLFLFLSWFRSSMLGCNFSIHVTAACMK